MPERIIRSTIQQATCDVDTDAYDDAVAHGTIVRSTSHAVGDPGESVARVVAYTDPASGGQRWALDWYDVDHTGLHDWPTRGEAEAAYEAHVRELAEVGWSWDETDVDTVTTLPDRTVADHVTAIASAHDTLRAKARDIATADMLRGMLGESAYWAWDTIRRSTRALGTEATSTDLTALVSAAVADMDVEVTDVVAWIRPRQEWDDGQ